MLAFGPAISGWAYTTSNVSFQQNVDGYTDGFQIRISGDVNNPARDGTNGNTSTSYLIDGFQTDDPLTTTIEAYSPDEQDLIRFANIFGAGAGKIPLGATILDAKLTYTTATTTNAESPGPFGVSALLQPFTAATRYTDFPSSNSNALLKNSRGAWFRDGADQEIGHPYSLRPVGAFAGPNSSTAPLTGTNVLNGVTSANVRQIVQHWSNDSTGENNYGMVVHAGFTGQTNGWGFWTNGNATPSNRPKLSVTYTTDPIAVNVFQRGLNGYSGGTVARISSGADYVSSLDDVTINGDEQTGSFYIDESEATGTGNRFRTLFKFTGLFGEATGQAPADKPVAKAWLVLTTGLNDDNRSPGPFSVHKMLRDWDVTTTYGQFGAVPGLQEADGDIGPAIDTVYGSINGQETSFDVTSYVENLRRNPLDPDFGLAVAPYTNDGWGVMLSGATDISVRPKLIIYSDLSTAPAGVPGDYNNNGIVDGADYVVWRKGGALQNEVAGVTPGLNTAEDYAAWRARFGNTSGSGALSGGAVPEPSVLVLGLFATIAFSLTSNRNR